MSRVRKLLDQYVKTLRSKVSVYNSNRIKGLYLVLFI